MTERASRSARMSPLVRDGAIAGVSSLVMSAATYAFYAVATRSLGVDGGGSVLAVVSAMLLCSLPFGVAGLAASNVVASLRVTNETAQLRGLLTQAALGGVIGTVLVVVATVAAGKAILAFFHLGDERLVWLGAVGFVANAVLLFARGVLQGFGDFRAFGISNCVEAIVKIAAAVLLVEMPSVETAIGTFSAALFAASAYTVGATRRWVPDGSAARGALALALRRSKSVIAVMGAVTFMTFFDSVAARHYLTARDAGLYNAASLCGRALMTVLAFVPAVILPKVAERFAAGETTAHVGRLAAIVTGGICLSAIGLFAAAPAWIIVTVGGSAYRGGAPLVPWYGCAAAALSLASVLVTYRLGRNERRFGRFFLAIAAAEFAAILTFHNSSAAIVGCIVAGHSLALLVALLPAIGKSAASARRTALAR